MAETLPLIVLDCRDVPGGQVYELTAVFQMNSVRLDEFCPLGSTIERQRELKQLLKDRMLATLVRLGWIEKQPEAPGA